MTKEEAIKMFLDDGAAELSVKAEQGGHVTTELRGCSATRFLRNSDRIIEKK